MLTAGVGSGTSVSNVPSCGNDLYINEILRKQFQFDGFVVSDVSWPVLRQSLSTRLARGPNTHM